MNFLFTIKSRHNCQKNKHGLAVSPVEQTTLYHVRAVSATDAQFWFKTNVVNTFDEQNNVLLHFTFGPLPLDFEWPIWFLTEAYNEQSILK